MSHEHERDRGLRHGQRAGMGSEGQEGVVDQHEQGRESEGAEVVVLDVTRGRAPAPVDHDVEVDGAEVVAGQVVDPPDLAGPPAPGWLDRARSAERRPVVPGWLTNRSDVTAAVRWAVRFYGHTVLYHLARLPVYAARLVWRAPFGAVRLAVEAVRWEFDAQSAPVVNAAVRRESAEEYLKLTRQRDGRVRWRSMLTAAVAVGCVAGVVQLAGADPLWQVLAAAVLVGLLGVAGSPADRPLIDRAVIPDTEAPKLTSDVVVRALSTLGIVGINQTLAKGLPIEFPAPITRDGPGYRADVNLPHGVTAADVLERRRQLASGLRRPLGCVWPEPVAEVHEGRLVLWVADTDMSRQPPAAWPLARKGTADLFRPVPFGADQRGRSVAVPLMYANVLIGAMPRVGKTFALRILLLACALDVRAELRVFELKGSGDLGPLERVAHHYASGADDDTIEALMASLREVYRELDTRAKTIRELPREQAPENKVTPELASRKGLGLHPLVLAVDECQELFSHPEHGKEAAVLCTAIIKRGPAFGVILLLATQRPDKDSLPTGVSANVGIRFCLRVMGQIENDMVLGTSAYKNGLRATQFTMRDLGIGYLLGAAPDPQVVRSAYLDGPAAEKVCERARQLRDKAGRLTGHAAGDTQAAPAAAVSLLDDVLAVVGAGETKVWSETVIDRLAELRPETYGGWEPEQLAGALRPHGIDTVQISRRIDGRQVNRRGIDRATIAAAVTERDRRRETG